MPSVHWKWRAVVFALLTAGTLARDLTYRPADPPPRLWPPVTMITDTWYGATLWTLVPVSLLWLSLGFKSRSLKIAGVILALLVGARIYVQIHFELSMFGRSGYGW
jgi:hypothetical protein